MTYREAWCNDRDNEGNTPLHLAVKRINREKFATRDYEGIVRLLLEKKADVHTVNVGGATPLHTAAAFRADPTVIEMLIEAGADVNLKASANVANCWHRGGGGRGCLLPRQPELEPLLGCEPVIGVLGCRVNVDLHPVDLAAELSNTHECPRRVYS